MLDGKMDDNELEFARAIEDYIRGKMEKGMTPAAAKALAKQEIEKAMAILQRERFKVV